MCKVTKAVRRRVGVREHSEPTHPHQLSPPDAVPTSVCQNLGNLLTHSPLFYFSGGGDFHVSFFSVCLLLFFYVQSKFHPTLL